MQPTPGSASFFPGHESSGALPSLLQLSWIRSTNVTIGVVLRTLEAIVAAVGYLHTSYGLFAHPDFAQLTLDNVHSF
jgi:hypothetical protein